MAATIAAQALELPATSEELRTERIHAFRSRVTAVGNLLLSAHFVQQACKEVHALPFTAMRIISVCPCLEVGTDCCPKLTQVLLLRAEAGPALKAGLQHPAEV